MTKNFSFSRSQIALLVILAGAVIVRIWGLDFGLPHPWARPDESRLVNMAIKFGQGDLNPPFFNYPTLYPYLLTLLFGLYYLVGRLFGTYGSVYDLVVEFATEPTNFYLIDRALSALTGVLTVLVLYHIGKRLLDRTTGLVASLLTAFAYLHVRDSHFGVTDVPMTFLIMLSVLFIVRAMQTGRLKDYALAAITAGLAASTKYAGFMLLFPMFAAHIFVVKREHQAATKIAFDRRILAFGVLMLAAFFLGTPYALLEFPRFLTDLLSEARHLDSGHMGVILDRGWWYHLSFSLYYGVGWPLLLAALAGIVLLAQSDFRKAVVLCIFPLLYYLWVGKGYTVFVRYIIPVIPFLCVLSAVTVTRLNRYIFDRRSSGIALTATVVLVAVVMTPSVYRLVRFNDLLTHTDSRLMATDWITEHLPAASSIYQVNSGGGALQLAPGQYFLERYDRYESLIADGYQSDRTRSTVTALVDSLKRAGTYRLWRFDGEKQQFMFEGWVQDSLPEYIVTERVPLKHYDVTPGRISDLLEASYSLSHYTEAFDSSIGNAYDLQDHFYLPFDGFDGVTRPGPNIFIYERVD
ncbi:MAG: glycosyltransferase family 39 protein [Candidatus Zixiibacteriota bacterium]|nr:MAG: glycosyltransferase family 39 protein [candidate division Zixibacteria bacterium]